MKKVMMHFSTETAYSDSPSLSQEGAINLQVHFLDEEGLIQPERIKRMKRKPGWWCEDGADGPVARGTNGFCGGTRGEGRMKTAQTPEWLESPRDGRVFPGKSIWNESCCCYRGSW